MALKEYIINTPAGKRQLSSSQFYGGIGQRYKTLYKSRTTEIQIKGMEAALLRLQQMREAGADLSSVFQDVLVYFKNITRGNFKARRTPDKVPQRWVKLSARYAKWKQKNVGTRIANLIGKTGRLRDAVFGGAGWFESITPTTATWGIAGIPYAKVHQYGFKGIPARRYFLSEGGNFPPDVMNYMVDRIIDYIRGPQ